MLHFVLMSLYFDAINTRDTVNTVIAVTMCKGQHRTILTMMGHDKVCLNSSLHTNVMADAAGTYIEALERISNTNCQLQQLTLWHLHLCHTCRSRPGHDDK